MVRLISVRHPLYPFLNFHALDKNGQGTDASVINAINQAIQLQSQYNIRVINLSQQNPQLTPDQVKALLMATAYKTFPQYTTITDGSQTFAPKLTAGMDLPPD